METVAEFNDNKGFNVKLTNEKIFIEAAGSSETIALRGLNGVGLYDDIEKYNAELTMYEHQSKSIKNQKPICIIIGIASLLFGLWLGEFGSISVVIGVLIIIAAFIIPWEKFKPKKPMLHSYFRLMLSGGDRKFRFNKSDESSVRIADFINKVEDTLTAYK